MKKHYIIGPLAILAAVFLLTACGPEVRIENAPATLPMTARTTAVPTVPTVSGQPSASVATSPSATLPEATSPGATSPPSTGTQSASGTVTPRPSSPVVVLESDEIVPIPATLLLDLNKTLDDLLKSIGQLEAPDENVLVFP